MGNSLITISFKLDKEHDLLNSQSQLIRKNENIIPASLVIDFNNLIQNESRKTN